MKITRKFIQGMSIQYKPVTILLDSVIGFGEFGAQGQIGFILANRELPLCMHEKYEDVIDELIGALGYPIDA